jgi:S-adenosylmethionine decarboxylase
MSHPAATAGEEWIVEALGCHPGRLGDVQVLQSLFEVMVRELALNPVGAPLWHRFPGAGGVTGMLMLSESHLTIHTFPEHASACLNLFCCTPRAAWAWDVRLRALLGAERVDVRLVRRSYAALGTAVTAMHASAVAPATVSP